MINERIAPILLNGEILSSVGPDPELYQALLQMLQNFCGCLFSHVRKWQIQKNWRYLKVALKLFKEGNETVKNGIVTIYLFSISNALCGKKELTRTCKKFFPKEFITEFHDLHHSSGI